MKRVFVLAAIAAAACQPGHSHRLKAATGPSATTAGATGQALPIQAEDLAAAFRTDPAAAQLQYGGKPLAVTGDVASVWRNGIDVVATLREPGSRDTVLAALDEDLDGSTDKVRQGQTITVDCTDLHAYDKPMMLRRCKLSGMPS